MKIALLNLQYDNNYGGNLQRYALMKILQRMGHDVTHLNLRFNYDPAPLHKKILRTIKRIITKTIFNRKLFVFPEYYMQKKYEESCKVTDMFYEKYINHTPVIEHKQKLSRQTGYNIYLVGSDQVWRKTIASIYGIDTFFLDFLPDNAKRIAYGVSFGTDQNELTDEDIERLGLLYTKFQSVSVREDSALELFNQYNWDTPQAIQVLDPTLLLSKEDYLELINDGTTHRSEGSMFCYILDPTEEKSDIIKEYEHRKELKAFSSGLDYKTQMPVQQWLRSFNESDFVITDSYHGMVFSIIFNKPFKLINNTFRGNARFESLFRQLLIPEDTENIDWGVINNNISYWRNISLYFLQESLR